MGGLLRIPTYRSLVPWGSIHVPPDPLVDVRILNQLAFPSDTRRIIAPISTKSLPSLRLVVVIRRDREPAAEPHERDPDGVLCRTDRGLRVAEDQRVAQVHHRHDGPHDRPLGFALP